MHRLLLNIRDFIKGRTLSEVAGKGMRLVKREGFAGLKRLFRELVSMDIGYEEWIHRYDTLTESDRDLIRRHVNNLVFRPKISVVMPVFNPPAEFLRKAIASVRRQLYPNWELCIADDASTQTHVRPILEDAVRADARIRVVFRPINGHISHASNTALRMTTGEFVALLDHDDELSEHALYHVVVALNENPALDLLYSDQDKIDSKGRRFDHYFKPDWNPDLFHAQDLVNHLGIYRRQIALEIGGFQKGFEGSQNWDFALRFVDSISTERIHHIARILYHERAISGSKTVSIDAKEHTIEAAKRALLNHWQRRGILAIVTPVERGHFVTNLQLPKPAPLVSIIICTRNRVELLRQCLDGIDKLTDYPNIETIIVDNGSDDDATLRYLNERRGFKRTRVLRDEGPFNFSALNNLAVKHAQGAVLCLINNDVVPIGASWLADMVAQALRPEIGAVGAKLYYPDGSIQLAGIILNGVAAGHLHLGYPGDSSGYCNRARLPQNFLAITAACMVVRKSIWLEVDGLDELFAVAFNDVDFCLRVQQCGYRNLWLPQAELHHHESASRGKEDTLEKQLRFTSEINLLRKRWEKLIDVDPAWNPNLALNGARIGLASPPRTTEPWTYVVDDPLI